MTQAESSCELISALDMFRAEPAALSWPERRELAQMLGKELRGHAPIESVMDAVNALAQDSKPEVRQVIASLLHLVDDAPFVRLGAALLEDTNAFVRRAAERSLARRRRGEQDADRKRRRVDQIHTEYATIERLHGALAAQRAQRMAQRFVDVVVGTTAHNLGGVITSLKLKVDSLARSLEQNPADIPRATATTHALSERIDFLERLVRDMTEYARPLSTERRRERLAAIVRDAHRLVREALGPDKVTGVNCEIDVPEQMTIDVVRHLILMALANVLKNAYEAIDAAGGTVVIKGSTDGRSAIVTVEDSGHGLEATDLDELREFVPGRTSKKNSGTGFGLPIARRYITAHGGSIEINSEPERGTTVTMRIPLDMEEMSLDDDSSAHCG